MCTVFIQLQVVACNVFFSFHVAYNQVRRAFFVSWPDRMVDDSQSFLGCAVDKTFFSPSILFSITCTYACSVIGGIIMYRRQL